MALSSIHLHNKSLPHSLFLAGLPAREEKSCGGKHDTLVKIYHYLEVEPMEGVVVPLPHGVLPDEVETYLRDKAPLFFHYWKELGVLYRKGSATDDQFFDEPQVIELIQKMEDEIKKAMVHFPLSSDLTGWVKEDDYYMVRSSGAEDGKKTANAGGNLSCKYVAKKEMPERIGDVVESYYAQRSLLNRLRSGEKIFEVPLPFAVTVQEMIGETIGGEKEATNIPVAVVLFTNEPLYIGKEPFRVMKMSACFGHGEGVVGNQGVLTDTVFVLHSLDKPGQLYVWYESPEKKERLAPVRTDKGIELQLINNPEEIVHATALSSAMVKKLFQLGLKMEKFFQEPTDMELVIKKGVIHIVQARPVNRTLPTSPANYIDLESSTIASLQEGKVLVSGESNVVTVHSAKEILVEETLELAHDHLRSEHRLVITRQDEPLNSHPIIQMSEKLMPCLYQEEGMENLTARLSETESKEAPVLLSCMQQGVVGVVTDSSQAVIQEGTICHPAPLSCSPDPFPWRKRKKENPKELQTLLKRIRTVQTTEQALKIFEQLIQHPQLKQITDRISYFPLKGHAVAIENRIEATLKELGLALKAAKQGERLQLLFYAKAVETLIWGAGYSLIRLQELSDAMALYAEKVGKSEPQLAEESLIVPMVAEVGDAWVHFLVTLEKDHPRTDCEALKKLVQSIGSSRSLWLTFFFDPLRKRAPSTSELLKALTAGFDEASQLFVEGLRKTEQLIDRFKMDIFADPKARGYSFEQLLALTKRFEDPAFIETFSKSRPLAQIIAAQMLAKAITLFDSAIKIAKATPYRTLLERAVHFQGMLRPYLAFLKTIALKYVGENKFPAMGYTLERYIAILEEVLEKKLDTLSPEALAELFAASPEFSVLAAMWGSGAFFNRHRPVTFEDLFTLIHQNLNACASFLLIQNLSFNAITPPPLFLETVRQFRSFQRIQLLGVEQENDQLVLRYNAPLRNHSSTFQLAFREGKVFLTVQMLGQARDRWTQTQHYLRLLDDLKIQPLHKKVIQRGDVLNFTWCLASEEEFEKALNLLRVVYDFSLNQSVDFLHRDLLERITKLPSDAQPVAYERAVELAGQFILESVDSYAIKSGWSEFLVLISERGVAEQKIGEVILRMAQSAKLQIYELENLLDLLIGKKIKIQELATLAEGWRGDSKPTSRRGGISLTGKLAGIHYTPEKTRAILKSHVADTSDEVYQKLTQIWAEQNMEEDLALCAKGNTKEQKLIGLVQAHSLATQKKLTAHEVQKILHNLEDEADPLISRRMVQLFHVTVKEFHLEISALGYAKRQVKKGDELLDHAVMVLMVFLAESDFGKEALELINEFTTIPEQSLLNQFIKVLIRKKQLNADLENLLKPIVAKVVSSLTADAEPHRKGGLSHFFVTVVNEGFLLDQALAFVEKWQNEKDTFFNVGLIEVLQSLYVKGITSDKAERLLPNFLKMNDIVVQDRAMMFLQAYVHWRLPSQKIVPLLKICVHDPDFPYRDRALGLFSALVDREEAKDEAFALAEEFSNDTNLSLNFNAIELLKKLVRKDSEGKKSFALFARLLFVQSPQILTQATIGDLIGEFIKEGKNLEAIVAFVEKWLTYPLYTHYWHIPLICLEKLARKEGYEERVQKFLLRYMEVSTPQDLRAQAERLLVRLKSPEIKYSTRESDGLWDEEDLTEWI